MKIKKQRSAPAVDAWSRHGGAHSGTARPDYDDTDEQILDIMLEGEGVIEIDGELYEIEFDWDHEGEDDEEE